MRPITLDAAPRATRFQTANGLDVVLDPDPNGSSVVVAVRYHVGRKDEPVGKTGLAHLVEHLSFGVEPEAGKDISAAYERIGADSTNGGVSLDVTDYVAAVPPAMLEQALALEASRMTMLALPVDETAIVRERAIIQNEARTRAARSAAHVASSVLAAEVFGESHPYGHLDRIADLERIGSDDLRAFADRYYRPSNATLVISGPFDPMRVRELIAAKFGAIPAGASRAHRVVTAPQVMKTRTVVVRAPVPRALLAVGWAIPPIDTDAYDALALATPWMKAELVKRMTANAMADGVDVRMRGGHLGGLIEVSAGLRNQVPADRALFEVDKMLVALGELGRARVWDNFEALRRYAATRHAIALASDQGRVSELLNDVEYIGELRSVGAMAGRFDRFSAADIGSAVQKFLVDAFRIIVVVEPDPSAPFEGVRR